jgi:hypothetical protein
VLLCHLKLEPFLIGIFDIILVGWLRRFSINASTFTDAPKPSRAIAQAGIALA